MKSHQANGHTKKPGKRTYTLKELVQRDLAITDKLVIQNEPTETSLVDIQEDLWIEPTASGPSKQPLPQHENLAPSIERLNQLIRKEITQTALQLNLEPDELQAWIDLQAMAPKQTLLALLRLAREYSLDPLTEEVALALYENEHWQAYITVEGYSKILNRHPAFDGICFNQSPELTNGIPIWMECVIYRKDRSQPTAVREYFDEVKGEQAIWGKMPRRMLRHRVMQQCARLALG
jgi:hypothetical protein